jgi:hypothetical protein
MINAGIQTNQSQSCRLDSAGQDAILGLLSSSRQEYPFYQLTTCPSSLAVAALDQTILRILIIGTKLLC